MVCLLERDVGLDGYAVAANGEVSLEAHKYLHNLLSMPATLIVFLTGVVLVLCGIGLALTQKNERRAIWLSGIGTTMAVLAVFLIANYSSAV